MRIHIDTQLFKYSHGILIHFLFIDGNTGYLRITAQPDIVHNAALKGLVEFLVNHCHAIIQRLFTAFEVDFLAVQENLSAVLGINTKQALHQRGFAGTIFAHQRMDRALLQLEVNTVQSLDAGECFCDANHPQQNILLHSCISSLA